MYVHFYLYVQTHNNLSFFSPAMFLTQESGVPPSPGDFIEKDLYTKPWRHFQALANQFGTAGAKNTYHPFNKDKNGW